MKHLFRNDGELDAFMQRMDAKGLTDNGREKPDPRPMQPPVGYVKQPSMFEHMRAMVAMELARRDASQETPEDAADMGDDEDDIAEALSQYERYDLEMELARRQDLEAREAASAAASSAPGDPPADGPETPVARPVAPVKPAKGKAPIAAPDQEE